MFPGRYGHFPWYLTGKSPGLPTTNSQLKLSTPLFLVFRRLFNNSLTGVTSFSHLLNLENLDISNNALDSLRRMLFSQDDLTAIDVLNKLELECLRHLRELRADGNRIDNIDGLQKMDGLVKLSLQRNSIRSVDLTNFRWFVPSVQISSLIEPEGLLHALPCLFINHYIHGMSNATLTGLAWRCST